MLIFYSIHNVGVCVHGHFNNDDRYNNLSAPEVKIYLASEMLSAIEQWIDYKTVQHHYTIEERGIGNSKTICAMVGCVPILRL